ncbi:hypothetical protein F7725_017841 [Dissostichus mawsoni]|uniref:C-type lectin domain-containing protein n=1 Tax=Dissostichus mawsoni TaxID=36200 RepID=A0A7J5XPV6_DISMA|nr:hypothetical protein F7725_017841 [Dissostichus mawsoni]
MTTNWNELSISQAQWSIDSYCLGNTVSTLSEGWFLSQPSCYVYNIPKNKKTWEEAQEDCKGKNSDLAVAHNSEEKAAIKEKSIGYKGFWIGLRVVNKQWKWVDGSDLTDISWIDLPDPADGHCAVFYKGRDTWSAVRCDKPRQWICQKKALTLSRDALIRTAAGLCSVSETAYLMKQYVFIFQRKSQKKLTM